MFISALSSKYTHSFAVSGASYLFLLGHNMSLVKANGNAGLGLDHCARDFAEETAKSPDNTCTKVPEIEVRTQIRMFAF